MRSASPRETDSLFELAAELRHEPATPLEASFEFWDRIGGEHWSDLRGFIDRCYRRLPSEERRDVRARWRSGQDDQLQAVWWELLLHECLICSGAEVESHPASESGSRVDFGVKQHERSYFVEAHRLGPSPEARKSAERAKKLDAAIESMDLDGWRLAIGPLQVGDQDPNIRLWQQRILAWLGSAAEKEGKLPALVIEDGGWRTTLHALKVPTEGYPYPRNILMRVGAASFVRIGWPLRKVLHHKFDRYPGLEPLVIAGQLNAFETKGGDIRVAMLGHDLADARGPVIREDGWLATTGDGFWMTGAAPQNTHVAGLIVGESLGPGIVRDHTVSYWPNPWADEPVANPCPWWDTCVITPTGVRKEPATVTGADFFGLPVGWAGQPSFPAVDQWASQREGE